MYFSDKVKLVARTGQLDAIGNTTMEETTREVFADIRSISRAEFTAAGANGLKPAAVVVVHTSDYKGERVVEVDGKRLVVYRDFRAGETVELYTEQQMGESNG